MGPAEEKNSFKLGPAFKSKNKCLKRGVRNPKCPKLTLNFLYDLGRNATFLNSSQITSFFDQKMDISLVFKFLIMDDFAPQNHPLTKNENERETSFLIKKGRDLRRVQESRVSSQII